MVAAGAVTPVVALKRCMLRVLLGRQDNSATPNAGAEKAC
jgi:hypothetical protein